MTIPLDLSPFATVAGRIYADHSPQTDAALAGSGFARFTPLGFTGQVSPPGIPQAQTVYGRINPATGELEVTELWAGRWRCEIASVESFTFDVEAGQEYALSDLRGYVPPPGTTVQTVPLSGASAETLPAGSQATAELVGGVLRLGIPAGERGEPGPQGEPGPPGSGGGVPSAGELRGVGSPVGVVTPPYAGAAYSDVAGTAGAWRWLATGTDASSWVVILGDTGLRLMDAPGSGAQVLLRRAGSVVTLAFECELTPPAQAYEQWLPRGFCPPLSYYDTIFGMRTASPALGVLVSSSYSSGANVWGGDLVLHELGDAGWGIQGQASWVTSDPWPTTLPGDPA